MNLGPHFICSSRLYLTLLLIITLHLPTARARDFVILQSTTSTHNSGLLEHLIPQFESTTGIQVRTVAVGTGQALENGRNGDGRLGVAGDRRCRGIAAGRKGRR